MSGGPWMRRGGLPRPGERFPIFVPDLYPDCPRELESLRNASAPDNRDEQRRIADDRERAPPAGADDLVHP